MQMYIRKTLKLAICAMLAIFQLFCLFQLFFSYSGYFSTISASLSILKEDLSIFHYCARFLKTVKNTVGLYAMIADMHCKIHNSNVKLASTRQCMGTQPVGPDLCSHGSFTSPSMSFLYTNTRGYGSRSPTSTLVSCLIVDRNSCPGMIPSPDG